MFLTLLRKDWHLAKPAFVFMVALLFAPLVLSITMTQFTRWTSPAGYREQSFSQNFANTSVVGFGASLRAIPAVAACQLGREKRERSIDFLTALPIPRHRIIASKLAITLMTLLIPAAVVTLGTFLPLLDLQDHPAIVWNTLRANAKISVFIVLGIGGMGWFFSCFLASEIYATALSIMMVAIVGTGLALAFNLLPSLRAVAPGLRDDYFLFLVSRLSLGIAVIGFGVGTLVALFRRTL